VFNLEYGLRTATQRFTRYLTNTILILSPPFLNSLKKTLEIANKHESSCSIELILQSGVELVLITNK